jgi:hypothetical protein
MESGLDDGGCCCHRIPPCFKVVFWELVEVIFLHSSNVKDGLENLFLLIAARVLALKPILWRGVQKVFQGLAAMVK